MESEKVFRSKIGLEFLLPILLLLGWATGMVIKERLWFGIGLMSLTIIFVSSVYIKTYYSVSSDKKLQIICSVFAYPIIEVSKIKRIQKSFNPSGSPALSLDRLEIAYNEYDTILISPKDKAGFISYLQSINPGIEVVV